MGDGTVLLVKHPRSDRPPDEFDLELAHGTARAFPVLCGQLLTIIDVKGGRPVALYAFTNNDAGEFLSPHHTRVFSNTYVLKFGMRLVTNRRRSLFVLGRDTVRKHDLLMPASTTRYLREMGHQRAIGVREAVLTALEDSKLTPPKLPDPVTLFAHVEVRPNGRLISRGAASKAGDYVTFRVLIDSTCVAANCASGLFKGESKTPIKVRVHNEV